MTNGTQTPPIFDIDALVRAESTTASAPIVTRIHQACLNTGFFIAVGHGLDAVMETLFDQAQAFFGQPQAAKEETPRISRYGFIPWREQALDPTRQLGNAEYLDLGLGDEIPLPDLDGFAEAVRAYQAMALQVANQLLEAIAVALGAPGNFFADRMSRPQCRLRLLHYPIGQPHPDGSLPVPTETHTDYGAITLLATDGVPGLEVKPIGGAWIPVEAPAGSLVVNLGDMLARWTNDRYRSTPHRVVGPVGTDRISIPFFINPDPATIVECIPSCVSDDRPCGYEPITAGEFLATRIDSPSEQYVNRSDGPKRHVNVSTEPKAS